MLKKQLFFLILSSLILLSTFSVYGINYQGNSSLIGNEVKSIGAVEYKEALNNSTSKKALDNSLWGLNNTGLRSSTPGWDVDIGNCVIQSHDGGYMLVGSTNSFTNGGYDYMLFKISALGKKNWRKNYGTILNDYARSIKRTSDGGYIIAGNSEYFATDINMLVYKLNAIGEIEWASLYGGGSGNEYATEIQQTSDGGYIVAGYGNSYTNGGNDLLVYKLYHDGVVTWRRNFGGISTENGASIIQTSDGGYAILGESYSFSHGSYDFILYKLNADGSKRWRKNFGGTNAEWYYYSKSNGTQLIQTSDGGYLLGGSSLSFTNGDWDMLIYKLNTSGSKQWRKNFGGPNRDILTSLKQTSDGGYILAGHGTSFTNGSSDFLVYKLTSTGKKQWRKNFGGIEADYCQSVNLASDGGYVLFGYGLSFVNTPGYYDFLIYKMTSTGKKQWRKNFGQ